MANSDYTRRNVTFGFCPVAALAGSISYLDEAVVMTGYTSPIADGIRIGMAAMIDDEIVVVRARAGNNLTLGRGTCDTVPAPHDAGAVIWFFDDSVGGDTTEYGGTETVGVKVITRTSTAEIPIEHSPPQGVTFNLRFARPYPPGLVEVDGQPWFEVVDLVTDMEITWTHRDRIGQQDVLVAHEEASVGPEAGTTYRLRVFKADNTLVNTQTVAGTSFTYTRLAAVSHFGVSAGTFSGYIILESMRDSLESFQNYRIDFGFVSAAAPYGLGFRLGEHIGGYPP